MSGIDATTIENRLERASQQVSSERGRLTDERDAFAAFATRVRELDISQSTATPPVSGMQLTTTGRTQQAFRDAYRETVMAVPHFEAEYDETYRESLRAELGPDIASLLVGNLSCDERHRQAVLHAVEAAIERRTQLAATLETEATSVSAATDLPPIATELSEMEQAALETLSSSVLDAHLARLDVLAEKCTDRLDERQSTLVEQRHSLALAIDDPDIPTYLYQDHTVQYPVVASITDLLDRIESVRAAIRHQLDQ